MAINYCGQRLVERGQVTALDAATHRLFRAERCGGAGHRTAWRAAYRQLLPGAGAPDQGIRPEGPEGRVSLALRAVRCRHGAPHGATAVSYSRAQTPTMTLFLFVMVVEPVGAEIMLRALGVPVGLRSVVLVVDAYSVLIVLAVIAARIR